MQSMYLFLNSDIGIQIELLKIPQTIKIMVSSCILWLD